jgi:capsular exopolysaccharide synthesis family protein
VGASALPARPNLNESNWLAILWKRKITVILTVIVFVACTELVTATLTKVYSTSATLIVAQPGRTQAFDTTQADEEAARSYSRVLASPIFADQVANTIGNGTTSASVQSAVSISPVTQTQLMTITAEDPSPARAQLIANTYATLFVQYAPRLSAQTKATVSLAVPAPRPTSPARPKPLLYGLVAALLGLGAGIALAFLRERFDVRIRSLDELPEDLDVPILADIPQRERAGTPERAFAESFRMLRTSLRMLGGAEGIRSIAMVSWSEGEGKTTVASELAIALASSGGKVLVVDGDIHRMGLSKMLHGGKPDRSALGLSEYLFGVASLGDATEPVHDGTLDLMPCGRQVTNLSNLLETPTGSAALAELSAEYGSVVIDTPPLSVGADAPAIASRVDGVILVVDLTKATTTGIRSARRQLAAANARILGIVINRNPRHASSAYAYYEYAEENNGQPVSRAKSLLGRARSTLSR